MKVAQEILERSYLDGGVEGFSEERKKKKNYRMVIKPLLQKGLFLSFLNGLLQRRTLVFALSLPPLA